MAMLKVCTLWIPLHTGEEHHPSFAEIVLASTRRKVLPLQIGNLIHLKANIVLKKREVG